MSKARNSATQPKTAGASYPPAAPAVSRAAPATGSTPTAEPDYELPSASEIGALLATESEPAEDPSQLSEPEDDDSLETAADADAGAAALEEAAAPAAPEPGEAPAPEATAEDLPEETPAPEEAESEPAEAEPGERFQKRINELSEARARAETEAATLREQLAAAKATTAADPLNPFALIDSEPELAAAVEREERFMEWIMATEANPEGGELPDGKGGTVHFEPEQIRQMKVNTYRILRTADKRREWIRQKTTREAEAAAAYPWLRTVKDGLGAEVQSAIEARPYLRQSPDYRTFTADAIVGARLRQAGIKLDEKGFAALLKGRPLARSMAPAATAPLPGIAGAAALAAARTGATFVRRAAPTPGRPGTLPPRLSGREAAQRQASKALSAGDGSLSSVESSIAAKIRW